MSRPAPGRPAQAAMVDQLRKVLELEQRRGFEDTAVLGGLDRFLRNWGMEAHRSVPHPMFRATLRRLGLIPPGYSAKSPGEREAWVQRVLQWAETLDGVGLEKDEREAARPRPPRRSLALQPGQGLDTPLAEVRGFTDYWLSKLSRQGVATVRDLLYLFPHRHVDFTQRVDIAHLEPGRDQTVAGTVWEASAIRVGAAGRPAAEAVIGDATGNVRVIWFNQPYMARALRRGMRLAVNGRVSAYRGRLVFENPEFVALEEAEGANAPRLLPVYPLTEGLTQGRLRGLMRQVVDQWLGLLAEYLPEDLRRRRGLVGLAQAVRQAHSPDSPASKEEARRRLAFDELLLIQLGVLERKRQWRQGMPGHPLRADPVVLDAYSAALPFHLTGAQRRCIQEIVADLGRSTPMARLLQGEVGSGKTAVALAAALVAVANGQQVAFMAPTEVLAEQHFHTLQGLLKGAGPAAGPQETTYASLPGLGKPLALALLTGSLPRKRKQEVQEMAARGEVDIVAGTHALFQKGVEFASLGLVMVDEQHRFGVMQRTELRQKGYNPHLLVMTATPIPRTLSLTVYGDLDISVIDELPAGRRRIRTRWLEAGRREVGYAFLRRQVAEGRQAFMVYPLIEESEKLDAAAARQEHQRLSRDVFPDLRVGLLHGRMKPAEKERVMRHFRAGELDILVSTAVVEVGIDVPNATVMLVESADRFGLAQLHQFRGRVGRGEHESFCILISDSPSPEASGRLRLLEEIDDGFKLAEEDLRLRGPGEFFGTRQSGMPDLRMASLSDVAMLEVARAEATAVFQDEALLSEAQRRLLGEVVERAWRHRTAAPGEA